MPQQRRFRRLGKATTAVSVGALTLVIMGSAAPPAGAAGSRATASAPCPKPVDPASTIKHWQCRLGKIRDQIFPPTKPAPKPAKPAKPAKPSKPAPDTKKPRASTPANLTPRSHDTGTGGATTYSQSDSLRPYTAAGANLPGFLPAPQVAADTGAFGGQPGGLADTRLIAPVAASEQTGGDQILWVALASGAAGAVGAMNISVLGRRVRRRPQS